MIAFSLMLFAAAVAAWIISTNAYLRFAAMLYAALAVAVETNLGASVVLIVCAVAPAMLALAFLRTSFAAPALVLCCLSGLTAAATGIAVLAFAPLAVAAIAIAAVRPTLQAILSASALALGAVSFAAGSMPALLAFSSAALLGLALQTCVQEEGGRESAAGAVRRAR